MAASKEVACVVSKGIKIRGKLSGSGNLIVEGQVEGNINLQDHLVVENTGILLADVASRELTVHGTVSGNVDASERVFVTERATVVGDIRAPIVVIADGARFRGNIEMDVPLPDDLE